MASVPKFAICFAGFLTITICLVNASPSPAHEFELKLEALDNHVKQGTVPRFRLALKNVSHDPQKILDLKNRIDFEFPYYHLIVTRSGRQVDLPSKIWDPGPISSSDWIVVPPGKTQVFTLSEFAECFEKLSPGVYQAHVEFWRNPYQSDNSAYPSEKVTFEVTK